MLRFAAWLRRLALFFEPVRRYLPWLNIMLAVLAWITNTYWIQGFCQPVPWASAALIAGTTAFLVWPWLMNVNAGLRYGALFLQGLFFTTCLYCAWFMEEGYHLLGLLFFWLILPALVWLPVFFGMQVLRRVNRAALTGKWLAFGLGVFSLSPVLWWADAQYREMQNVLGSMPLRERKTIANLVRVLPRTYMLERVAGATWRYHTSAEFILDGWRPPLHDPLLVICQELHWHDDFYKRDQEYRYPLALNDRIKEGNNYVWHEDFVYHRTQLYHQLFPANPIKPDCVCAHNNDGESYRAWVPGAEH